MTSLLGRYTLLFYFIFDRMRRLDYGGLATVWEFYKCARDKGYERMLS
jgi:hypothetical protein